MHAKSLIPNDYLPWSMPTCESLAISGRDCDSLALEAAACGPIGAAPGGVARAQAWTANVGRFLPLVGQFLQATLRALELAPAPGYGLAWARRIRGLGGLLEAPDWPFPYSGPWGLGLVQPVARSGGLVRI